MSEAMTDDLRALREIAEKATPAALLFSPSVALRLIERLEAAESKLAAIPDVDYVLNVDATWKAAQKREDEQRTRAEAAEARVVELAGALGVIRSYAELGMPGPYESTVSSVPENILKLVNHALADGAVAEREG